jgi:protein-tyrosine kinase
MTSHVYPLPKFTERERERDRNGDRDRDRDREPGLDRDPGLERDADAADVGQVVPGRFGESLPAPASELVPEIVVTGDPDSPAAEELRSLRSQLMLRWLDAQQRPVALAVVSAGAGEGRSWIAANLAVLFAQAGKRTILVDADLRRPCQHHVFGVPGDVGLSSILSGRATADAVIDIRAAPGLSLLPAGAPGPHPQELLAGDGFRRLLSALCSSADVVLVDTPAAEGCADAGMIAARAGAALVVAWRDHSSVPRVASLTSDLQQFGVQVVGAVLTGAPAHARRR